MTGAVSSPTRIRFASLSASSVREVSARPATSPKKTSSCLRWSTIVLLVTVTLSSTPSRSGAATL